MEFYELQLARRAHHDAREGKPLRPADVVRLLNVLWAEERRADIAEEKLKTHLTDQADQRLGDLLADTEQSPPAREHRACGIPARNTTSPEPP